MSLRLIMTLFSSWKGSYNLVSILICWWHHTWSFCIKFLPGYALLSCSLTGFDHFPFTFASVLAICSDKTLDQSHLVKEELVWHHSLRVLYSGREAIVAMSSWSHVSALRMQRWVLALSFLSHCYPHWNFSSWKPPTFRVDYPFSSRPFRKHPHRHTQGCVYGDPKPSKVNNKD